MIAKKIGNLLGQYENVEVHYTRTDDRDVGLSERAAMANNINANYFLSIHINAGGGTGFESYVYTKVDNATIAYQNSIHNNVVSAIGVANRGTKRADFAVLRETKMAAILTENLFIDNANDAAKLKSDDFLNKIAQGHVNGLAAAFGLKKKASPAPAVTNGKLYRVQVGAYHDKNNAVNMQNSLKAKGFDSVIVEA